MFSRFVHHRYEPTKNVNVSYDHENIYLQQFDILLLIKKYNYDRSHNLCNRNNIYYFLAREWNILQNEVKTYIMN